MAVLLLARLMGQYSFLHVDVCRCLSVALPAARREDGRRAVGRARGWSGGRHCTAGQNGYVPFGRHLVFNCRMVLEETSVSDQPIYDEEMKSVK